VGWLDQLKYDPIEQLCNSRDPSIVHFVEKDLLDESKEGDELWDLPEARKTVRRQRDDGSWEYPGGNKRLRSQTHYDQIETYRNLGFLVEKYDFDKSQHSIRRAADFLFSSQTGEGDFRGIYGNQYTPNYSAGITELLIKAGYRADRRIRKSLKWLLSIRQSDGGWAIPFRTRGHDLGAITDKKTTQPDTEMPSSWLVTGVVLRAFAVDPEYRQLPETIAASRLLMGRFFSKDSYPDRQAPGFWTRFAFPFWFTDLVSSLDSLSRLGFNCEGTKIQEGLRWFRDHQREDGSWNLKLLKKGDKQLHLWLALSICRVFKRFYPQ